MMRPTEERLDALGALTGGAGWSLMKRYFKQTDPWRRRPGTGHRGLTFQEGWACRKAPSMFEKL